jgi:hypothetical protein
MHSRSNAATKSSCPPVVPPECGIEERRPSGSTQVVVVKWVCTSSYLPWSRRLASPTGVSQPALLVSAACFDDCKLTGNTAAGSRRTARIVNTCNMPGSGEMGMHTRTRCEQPVQLETMPPFKHAFLAVLSLRYLERAGSRCSQEHLLQPHHLPRYDEAVNRAQVAHRGVELPPGAYSSVGRDSRDIHQGRAGSCC